VADRSALRAEGLRKSFGGLRAVAGVDLDLRPAELHAVIGPNGAGKTTLVNLVGGELRPDAGRVLLGGRDVTRLSVAARARLGLGRGFQVPRLFLGTDALGHALTGALAARGRGFGCWRDPARDPALVEAAREALAQVGLAGFEERPVASLSHGQRRRVELATVLAARPRVLLLDEPLAGLGPEEGAALVRLLAALRRGHAILLVEHDTEAVFALADRVSVLVEGRVVASGAPAEDRRDAAGRAAYQGVEEAA
jgi:branched-chain amino acid transport system ATP-binding protein